MGKNKHLTTKQQLFLTALEESKDGNVRNAMRAAGYSEGTTVREVAEALSEEIIEIANRVLAVNSVNAAMGLVHVLNNPADLGNDRRLVAAKEVLDRAGVIKKEQPQQLMQVENLYILPPKEIVQLSTKTPLTIDMIPLDSANKESSSDE